MQNYLVIKADGIYSYHFALKVKFICIYGHHSLLISSFLFISISYEALLSFIAFSTFGLLKFRRSIWNCEMFQMSGV
jgi:hypothetical protein